MAKIKFIAIQEPDKPRDGEGNWRVEVDGQYVMEARNGDMDISDNQFEPLWKALGVELIFDFELSGH